MSETRPVDKNGNPAEEGTEKTTLLNPDDLAWWYSQPWAEDWGTERRKQYFHAFVTEAPYQNGLPGPITPPSKVPWFDPKLAKKGRWVAEENLALLITGIITGLTFGRAFKNVSALFVKSFYPTNSSKARIEATMKVILAFNFGCTEDEDSVFFKEMSRVCEIHRLQGRPAFNPKIPPDGIVFPKWYSTLVTAIRRDIQDSRWQFQEVDELKKIIKWNPPLRFSQFDAALISFGIVAPIFMGINKMGMIHKEGMDGVLHMTAICGKLLGVSDAFNIALIKDPRLVMEMSQTISLYWLRDIDETVIYMMDCMLREVSEQSPLAISYPRVQPYLYFLMNLAGVEGVHLWGAMNWQDKLAHYFTKSILFSLRFHWVRRWANDLMRRLYKVDLHLQGGDRMSDPFG